MKKIKQYVWAIPFMMLILASACNNKTKVAVNPLKTIVLKIEQGSGTNGTSVTYNPQKQLYYTVIAGNTEYPLEVFDKNGNNLFTREAGFDVRGMWWNADKNMLEINGYDRQGIGNYKIDASGNPNTKPETLTKQSLQPDAQSAGAYDFNNKHIIYYHNGEIVKVKHDNFTKVGSITLLLPVSKDFINETTVIYTGIKGKEAGVLDYENKKVYLFDITNGKHTYTVNLPPNAITHSMFRFSFANGHIWLYDVDTRSWTGYKVF